MANKRYHYYVEGQDDKKVVDVLRLKMGLIESGRVDVLNVVTERITDLRLRTLAPGTIVVLVFDTDTGNRAILDENLRRLKENMLIDLTQQTTISCNRPLYGTTTVR